VTLPQNPTDIDIPEDEPATAALTILQPEDVIPTESILSKMQGITAADKTKAVLLGRAALSVVRLTSDEDERMADDMLSMMDAHAKHIEGKVRPFADIAYRLHRGLTSFLSSATEDLTAGTKHLRRLLAERLAAKAAAEAQRQREAREEAQRLERERLLAEAEHAETTGESSEVVEQILAEAAMVVAPPVVAQPITTLSGVSTRNKQKVECHDFKALVLHIADRLRAGDEVLLSLLTFDQQSANRMPLALNGIPGLRLYNEPILTRRRK
jgi:hypothetical protein